MYSTKAHLSNLMNKENLCLCVCVCEGGNILNWNSSGKMRKLRRDWWRHFQQLLFCKIKSDFAK